MIAAWLLGASSALAQTVVPVAPELPLAAPSASVVSIPAPIGVSVEAPPLSAAPDVRLDSLAAPKLEPVALSHALRTAARPGRDLTSRIGRLFDRSMARKGSVSAVGVPLGSPALGAAPEVPGRARREGRLPDAVKPDLYDIQLSINPAMGTFAGTETISARASEPTDEIELHAIDLSVWNAVVDGRPATIEAHPERESIVLKLAQPVRPGAVTIALSFSGKMNEQMVGLYRSENKSAFTKFEPTHARRMLPSFDEPAMKAVFRLTLTAPENLNLLSNMPETSQKVESGQRTVTYADSPRMSTYLFAFAAGELASKEHPARGTVLRAWAKPSELPQTDFALEVAAESLRRLEDYFDIPYGLPKLDLVAVPDFMAGAMEHWGAVFFRDTRLLVDPKLTSERGRRQVAETTTHELVHQWFGNLVTMEWWDDLWLNESFATWLASKILDKWRPDWRVWLEFEADRQGAFALDGLANTRAISSKAASSAQIDSMFDTLTYQKGGAVLRMLEAWIGEKPFRDGIRRYLKAKAHDNATADDLWGALEAASGKPVSRVASTWLSQPGHPIVEAELEGSVLTLKQRRFQLDGARVAGLWPVPVAVRYQLKGEKRTRVKRVLLEGAEGRVTLPKGVLWAYPNADSTGFYRVGLSKGMLSRLNDAELPAGERLGLLGDLWARAREGSAPISEFLEALTAASADPDPAIVEEVALRLQALERLAANEADRKAVGKFAAKLLAPHWKRLGWDGGDEDTRLARSAVGYAFGGLGRAPAVRTEAEKRLERYLDDPASSDATLVQTLLNLGAKDGDAALFDKYMERLKKATTPEQKMQYFRALSEFKDPALARRLLDLTVSDAVKGQDAWIPITLLLRNPHVQDSAWAFVKDHWKALAAKVGHRATKRLVEGTGALMAPGSEEDVRAFFTHPERGLGEEKALHQTLEQIRLGAKFRKTQAVALARWLRAK